MHGVQIDDSRLRVIVYVFVAIFLVGDNVTLVGIETRRDYSIHAYLVVK